MDTNIHRDDVNPMRWMDSIIYTACGGLLGSAAIGVLSMFGVPDIDETRILGIAIGAGIVAALRFKRVF